MLEVPANYFGKGDKYILPDDEEILADFNRRWDEYATKNPDDPLGEQALRTWEQEQKTLAHAKTIVEAAHKVQVEDLKEVCLKPEKIYLSPVSSSFVVPRPQPYKTPVTPLSEDALTTKEESWDELKLTLPKSYLDKLKNYARFKRRRPRDIVMLWISEYCKLE